MAKPYLPLPQLFAARTRTQVNRALIPCVECEIGIGASYTFLIPKHKSARNIFLEAVFHDGPVVTIGPATRE